MAHNHYLVSAPIHRNNQHEKGGTRARAACSSLPLQRGGKRQLHKQQQRIRHSGATEDNHASSTTVGRSWSHGGATRHAIGYHPRESTQKADYNACRAEVALTGFRYQYFSRRGATTGASDATFQIRRPACVGGALDLHSTRGLYALVSHQVPERVRDHQSCTIYVTQCCDGARAVL